MSERPWFKFFPESWRADSALRMCSPTARCLWMEMICLMAEAEPVGHLLVKGKPLTDRQLAVQTAMTADEVAAGLAELEDHGVFSRTPSGVIVSRKMVRDSRKSVEQSKRATKRWSTENADEIETGNAGSMPYSDLQSLEVREQKVEGKKDSSSLRSEVSPRAPRKTTSTDPVHLAYVAYNEMAKRLELPIATTLSPARRSKLKAAIQMHGPDGWNVALRKIEGNPFFHGVNDRGWRVHLDFLLQPSSLQKTIEGSYDRRDNVIRIDPRAEARRANELACVAGARAAFERAPNGRGGGFSDD